MGTFKNNHNYTNTHTHTHTYIYVWVQIIFGVRVTTYTFRI